MRGLFGGEKIRDPTKKLWNLIILKVNGAHPQAEQQPWADTGMSLRVGEGTFSSNYKVKYLDFFHKLFTY